MHSFPSFNKEHSHPAAVTHEQHGTDYTASAERLINTPVLPPTYDTNRSIRSRLPFIYTHQNPLYICRNLTQSNRSCCQHLCIQTCHFHSPIPSADRTTTTLYSPTLTWHYPQQSGHLTIPRLPLSPRKNHPHFNLSPDLRTQARDCHPAADTDSFSICSFAWVRGRNQSWGDKSSERQQDWIARRFTEPMLFIRRIVRLRWY